MTWRIEWFIWRLRAGLSRGRRYLQAEKSLFDEHLWISEDPLDPSKSRSEVFFSPYQSVISQEQPLRKVQFPVVESRS